MMMAACFFLRPAFSQKTGIAGTIKDEKGSPIPFVSIAPESGNAGTLANAEGEYNLPLPPGKHSVIFHCLGYRTLKTDVIVSDGFEKSDVTMEEQILQTKEVMIGPGSEDPANSIMRKAIARARINRMLLDAYKAEAYIKGSGRILDVPFLARPLLKKEGIDPNTVFFKETLEDIEFRQPNSYVEKVKASRSNFGKLEARQSLVKYELYSPRFGETVSPLSPSAFRYYTFTYLGAFTDFKHEVYKIKVSPRSAGEGIWAGEISIVDGLWCIHSADLSEEEDGIKNRFRQSYTPVEGIWLPTYVRLDARGKGLGIEFEAGYNAVIRKYRITKNQKLYEDYKKLEQKLDERTDEIIRSNPQKPDLKKKEKEDRKVLKQLARNYVKERIRNRKKENREKDLPASVVSNRVFMEDSSSVNNDTTFWKENRLVPLTQAEEKSYLKMDSIYKKEEKKDSIPHWKKMLGRSSQVLLLGKNFTLGKADSLKRKPWELKVFSPLETYSLNAVEGYHLEMAVWAKKSFGQSKSRFRDDRSWIQFGPEARYSFGRKKLLLAGIFQYGNGNLVLQISGGSRLKQIAGMQAVHPELNLLYARFSGRNLMKLYQTDFIRLDVLRKLSGRFELESGFGLEDRVRLSNSEFSFFSGKKPDFEPNGKQIPGAAGIDSLTNPGRLAEFRVQISWYPTLVSSLYNERQFFRIGNGPAIRFALHHAVPGIAQSRANFTRLDLSWTQSVQLWKSAEFQCFARAAGFLRKGFVAPMDAAHVHGNETFLIDGPSLGQFRNLPYYSYSTAGRMAELHARFFSEKMVLGWLIRKKKWREGLLVNILGNTEKPLFREFGYSLDRLFGFLSLEAVASGQQNQKPVWRFMAGISRPLNVEPKSFGRR